MAKARMTKKGNIAMVLSKPEATAVFVLVGQLLSSNCWGSAPSDIFEALDKLIVMPIEGYSMVQNTAMRSSPEAGGPLPVYEWRDA